MAIKRCLDCVFCKNNQRWWEKLWGERVIDGNFVCTYFKQPKYDTVNPITGHIENKRLEPYCTVSRSEGDWCGPDAKYFKSKWR